VNSIEKLWSSPKFRLLAVQLRYKLVSSKHRLTQTFYSHIQCANVFPIEIYQNYFREDIDADLSYFAAQLVSSLRTLPYINQFVLLFYVVDPCHRPLIPGNSLEPTVILTARASNFRLQHFPYYV